MSRRPLVPGQYLHIYISTHCLVLAITSELSQCRNLQQSIAPQHRARDPCVISAEISGAAVNKTNILPDPDCRLSN